MNVRGSKGDDERDAGTSEATSGGDVSVNQDAFFTANLDDSDFSPALKQTLRQKFESGEEESVDRDAFFKALGKAARSQDESSDEEQ